MKILTSREQVLPFVREWIELLAQDNYEKAVEVLYSEAEEAWTPRLLRRVVANCGTSKTRKDGIVFRVTPLASAHLAAHVTTIFGNVEWFDSREREQLPEYVRPRLFDNTERANSSVPVRVGMAFHTLPVNSEMSDLTVIFWVNAIGEDYALQLENVASHLGDMDFL